MSEKITLTLNLTELRCIYKAVKTAVIDEPLPSKRDSMRAVLHKIDRAHKLLTSHEETRHADQGTT